MNVHTRLEDLSNEIFFEIFDYLHAIDIFTGFIALNRRISSVLQSIPLRIVIEEKHCRHQIDFLSSHLTLHDHQVISIDICDTIRDHSSVISLLFNRHNFVNLQSCIFDSINPSTGLKNVMKQIKSLNRLVSFRVYQPNNKNLNENDKDDLARAILMHKSHSLRSIVIRYPYNYLAMPNYTSATSALISLTLHISGSPSTVTVYSILLMLRFCHTVRYLRIILEHVTDLFGNNNINVSNQAPPMNDNDLPTLPQMIYLELTILAMCNRRSIAYILRCMPNLMRLYFTLAIRYATWSFPDELLDGSVWQKMLKVYLPCLFKFEFHMSFMKTLPMLDLDVVVNSFKYFVRKYSNWHMIIDRWGVCYETGEELVMMRTLNYYKVTVTLDLPYIGCESFDTRSTRIIDDHYSFYPNIRALKIYMTQGRPNVTWSSSLFQQITHLVVEKSILRSWWNNLFDIVTFRPTINDDDAQQNVNDLSHFVRLSTVTQLEFRSTFDVSWWKDIQFILQACPNVINLIINTPLLLLSELIDNSSLISIFKQIKMIESITENIYLSPNFASKFVRRFPALSRIKLQVYSFDKCVVIIDIFLTQLEHLSYLKIYYDKDTLLDNPFSRNYIINKRRQTFPNNILDEHMIHVKNNGEAIEIWLS